ncbi:SIS domain-containing protein [Chloroflexia bacterium SDU3-3]|nr:SIS domain-containing protein [Chloroflexia bacterium SDU3-3]
MASFQQQIDEITAVHAALATLAPTVDAIAALVRDTVLGGGVLYTAGNGGSSTDAQHLAEELLARYRSNRRALPAIALTADSSVLTCIGNDFGYEALFSRQIEGLVRPGDVVLVFTTSGNSPNMVAALKAAREKGGKTVALLGKTGGACKGLADLELIVPSDNTARIQECHLQVLHYICEVVEEALV